MTDGNSFLFNTIGTVHSPYQQKFAIPRQANLVREAKGEVIFNKDYADPNCLREIEQFSHLWLIFVFHATLDKGWSPTVQPPRLGGKDNIGVFASRSMFRPNPLGLSVVENLGWEKKGSTLVLKIGGLDLLNNTPVLDIKPYIPYADCITQASGGYAASAPGSKQLIEFSDEAQEQLIDIHSQYPELEAFICSVLRQDPRPAWRRKPEDNKRYGMTLYDFNIKWCIKADAVQVLSIQKEKAD